MAYINADTLRTYLPHDNNTRKEKLDEAIGFVHSMIVTECGFEYEGPARARRLDATDDPELWLPAPGAHSVSLVVENGTTLTADQWELDPDRGRFLLRLTDNVPRNWVEARRVVVVTYVPSRVPEALRKLEIEETVSFWLGKSGGYATKAGTDGSSTAARKPGLSEATLNFIATLKSGYGSGSGIGGA